jgi:hypothetical protein
MRRPGQSRKGVLLFLTISALIIGAEMLWAMSGEDRKGTRVLVTRVVDGDTVDVGQGWRRTTVRLIGYRFQMFELKAIAHAGYRALSQNYETHTDGDLSRWDVIMHGPILGLTIRF